jgi:aryl-alcohol dehydrogenase-like predicted oxidoreductase
VRAACELGVNLFDTADVYGQGRAEEILGKALRELGVAREKVAIATKCGILYKGWHPEYTHKAYDASASYLKRSCEASLRRLQTDYVDLYQIHRVDYLTHPEETARAFEELRTEGKVRHAAVSNYTPGEIRALSAYVRLESLQARYSLLHLEPLCEGHVALCQEKGMALLSYSPLASGTLTGAASLPHHDPQAQRAAGMVAQLRPFATRYGATLGQMCLAWLIQQPGGVIPLVGTANAAHLREAVAAVDITLARDDWYEMLVIGRGRPIPWPMQPYVYTGER